MFLLRSLRAQLNLAIVLVLLLSFVGSVIINISNSRQFFEKQLTAVANNSTKHLAQQLQPLLEDDDVEQIHLVIDTEFSEADLKVVTLYNSTGKVIYQRKKEDTELPPQWFTTIVALNSFTQSESIKSEWLTDHVLEVTTNNSFAMVKLWDNTIEVAYFALLVFLITLLFGYLLLRQIYHPLIAITQKARAVQQHDYVEIRTLPWAIELKNVVLSMNLMVRNIKRTFDELTQAAELARKEAYIDLPTNIANARAYYDLLDEYFSNSSDYQGYIALVRINQLSELNEVEGYQAGNQLILDVIKEIKETLDDAPGFQLFRKSGSELSFFVETQPEEEIKSICTLLASRFKKLEAGLYKTTTKNIISFAVLQFKQADKADETLTMLDELALAAQNVVSGYKIQLDSSEKPSPVQNLKSQKAILEDILSTPKSSINLRSQKILAISEQNCFDYEIFTSFTFEERQLNASEVFSIANKHQLTAQLDQAILKKIIFSISQYVDKDEVLAVSIAHLSFIDSKSMQAIISLLEKSHLCEHFVVQIHERSVVNNLEYAIKTVKRLKNIGCKVCINHFGSSIESLHYLMEVKPDFVKLSPSFTRNIDKKSDNFQLVSAFVRMAHGLSMPVIAHCVETNEELKTLSSLHFDAALGFIIDKPKTARRQGVPDFINQTEADVTTLNVKDD